MVSASDPSMVMVRKVRAVSAHCRWAGASKHRGNGQHNVACIGSVMEMQMREDHGNRSE
jgi:hypothetical protein